MGLKTQALAEEDASKQQALNGETRTLENPNQESHCKKRALTCFYRRLEDRRRRNPLFLQRTLSYNLDCSRDYPAHCTSGNYPAPQPAAPKTSNTKALSNGVTREFCNESVNGHSKVEPSNWELEITASIFLQGKGDQWLVELGEKLSAMGVRPQVPGFFAVSSSGPLRQANSVELWPVYKFYPAWVPLVRTPGTGAKKLVLKLPGDAATPPQGQVFCLIWDDIRDILPLLGRASLGKRDIFPVAGLPPSGSGTWGHALLPAWPNQALRSAMAFVHRSKLTCFTRPEDLFGDQAIAVQASRRPGVTPIFKVTMRLSRAAPPLAHPAVSPVSHPVVLNAQRNRAPFLQSPSAHGPPANGKTQKVGFVFGSKEAGACAVTVSGLSCPVCMRNFLRCGALQKHLLGMHGRFRYTFKQLGPTFAVLASPSSLDSYEANTSDVEEDSSLSDSAPQTQPFVYWHGAYPSPEAAFQAAIMQERTKRKRQKQEIVGDKKGRASVVRDSEVSIGTGREPLANNGRASSDDGAKVQKNATSRQKGDAPLMSPQAREKLQPATGDRVDMQRVGKGTETAKEHIRSEQHHTTCGETVQGTAEAGGRQISEDRPVSPEWEKMEASEEADEGQGDEDRPNPLRWEDSDEGGPHQIKENHSIMWRRKEGPRELEVGGDHVTPPQRPALHGQAARSLAADMLRCTETPRDESLLSWLNERVGRGNEMEAQSSSEVPEGQSEQRAQEGSTSRLFSRLSEPPRPSSQGFSVGVLAAEPPASEAESSEMNPEPLDPHRTARNEDEGAMVPLESSPAGVLALQEGSQKELWRSPSKRKGGNKAKRKPMDEDRNIKKLQAQQFYHSRTGMPMDWEDVISAVDSEDEIDEEELQRDDKKLLNDFTDVSDGEKMMMFQWNCFARQQRIAADAHMRWAARAFAHVHKGWIGVDPNSRRIFMLMLFTFWNRALISGDDVDDCLKIVDSAR